MIKLIKVQTPEELAECQEIRNTVFCKEAGVPEEIQEDEFDAIDKMNKTIIHFLVKENNQNVGAFRIKCTSEDFSDSTECIIQRYAFYRKHRNKGFGKQSIFELESFLKSNYPSIKKISLDAKYHAKQFYEKCGFIQVGSEFMEADMIHYKMEKSL